MALNNIIISGYSFLFINNHNNKTIIDNIINPSLFVTCDDLLFVLSESIDNNTIYCFKNINNQYVLKSKINSTNANILCHLSVSKKHHLLFSSAWGNGYLVICQFDDNGILYDLQEIKYDNIDNKISRIHQTIINKNNDLLFVNNVGLDEIYLYQLPSLELIKIIKTPDDTNPRHAVLSFDEKILYTVCEKSNEILVYDLSDYKLIQRISCIPNYLLHNILDKTISNCSSIVISHKYHKIYVGNRYTDNSNNNTIVVFDIINNQLILNKFYSGFGIKPRHLYLYDDKILGICYQTSGDIYLCKLDDNGNILQDDYEYIKHPNASCLEFIK